MRFSHVTLCVCMSSFVLVAPAVGHISVTPGLLRAGDPQTLSLSVHNDLDRPMTGLSVSVPGGIRIVGAGGDWQAVVENETATWTGGTLAPNTGGRFELELGVDPTTPVGPVQLQAEQLYPNGGSLPWPIPVTVIPGAENGGANATLIVALLLAALLVIGSVAALALLTRRRGSTLQEK